MNINFMSKYGLLSVLTFAIITLVACSIKVGGGSFKYDLKGAQIPQSCKTAYVAYFKKQTSLGQPMLSQKLTDKLKDKLLAQTSLKLTNSNGDINFEGTIENYTTQPMAPQSNQVQAALNRLSVTIKVKYTNTKDSKFEYDTSFTRFIDYSSSQNLSTVENSPDFDKILDQLIQDVFDRAFVNW
jgi:hypothetical protein